MRANLSFYAEPGGLEICRSAGVVQFGKKSFTTTEVTKAHEGELRRGNPKLDKKTGRVGLTLGNKNLGY